MKRGGRWILIGIVLAACVVPASTASAATLIGDYQFQGTRSSSGPGPDLSSINAIGTFQNENVMGSSRQVLAFAQGSGLQMAPTGFTSSTPAHSVVMTFRLLDDTDYNRILDWSSGTADSGIYDHDRAVTYYRPFEAVESPAPVFGSNTYSTVAVTAADGPTTRVFVNGNPVIQSPHSETVIGDALRFFVDNSSGGNTDEDSAGAVSCIRVFSGVLSDSEIGAIGASPDCIAHPSAQQPPAGSPDAAKKKCKKHKRKHRSAESAKKKCKKKKRH
jgi:concanavalin A-like lectin/glucanase superfamily protein